MSLKPVQLQLEAFECRDGYRGRGPGDPSPQKHLRPPRKSQLYADSGYRTDLLIMCCIYNTECVVGCRHMQARMLGVGMGGARWPGPP